MAAAALRRLEKKEEELVTKEELGAPMVMEGLRCPSRRTAEEPLVAGYAMVRDGASSSGGGTTFKEGGMDGGVIEEHMESLT